jgi:transposase-like protein
MATGRPTDYTPELGEEIVKLVMLGEWSATDEQIALYCGVSSRTVYRWKQEYPEFKAKIDKAKTLADNRVEGVLFHLACAGNVNAALPWLRNRRPKEWRDQQNVQIEGSLNMTLDPAKFAALTPEQRAEIEQKLQATWETIQPLLLAPGPATEGE